MNIWIERKWVNIKMTVEEPYFMTNKEWFYFDELEYCYKLTDKATQEAKQSYKDFYELFEQNSELT